MTAPSFKLLAPKNNVTTPTLVGALGAGDTAAALSSGDGALFPTILRGAASSTGTSRTLNDTGDLGSLAVGDFILNLTDGSWAVVTSISGAPNSVVTTPLEGGSLNVWTSGDVWVIGAFIVTIIQFNDDGTVNKRERCLVTNRVSDTLTLVRGIDGDTPQSFDALDSVQMLFDEFQVENLQQAIRNLVQKIQALNLGTPSYAAATGSSSAYAITLAPAPATMAEIVGKDIIIKANHTNTGAVTVNINGLGAVNVKKMDGATALSAGDIQSGQIFAVSYDGTNLQMTTPVGQAPSTLTMADIGFFGTGADGAVTWSSDTNLNPATAWNFTTAQLDITKILSVSSVNTPLVLRNTGNVTLNGIVELDGKGGAGGAAGVDTGATGSNGGNGTDGASLVTGIVTGGGTGGGGNTIGGGGGGGASYKTAGSNGTTGSGGTSGAAGTGGAVPSAADLAMMASALSDVVCGAGGGGGGGSGAGNGKVGGNGGGAMLWYIGGNLTLGASSIIRARGTDASGGTGTGSGGAGGGGGGTVIILVKGTITNNGVTLQATAGAAGAGIGGGGTGGNGGAAGAGKIIIKSLTTNTVITA